MTRGPRIFLKKHTRKKKAIFSGKESLAHPVIRIIQIKRRHFWREVQFIWEAKRNHRRLRETWNEIRESLVKCFWFLRGSWSLYRRNNIELPKLKLIDLIELICVKSAWFSFFKSPVLLRPVPNKLNLSLNYRALHFSSQWINQSRWLLLYCNYSFRLCSKTHVNVHTLLPMICTLFYLLIAHFI